ncbi:MFS transporter [Roseospira marina]|uniref:MFS transporter n=1 Tax=Roseospira marina TaxID=140057 RepID=A0A5M6IA22_9PROT|nr:MFS transporter [Roseospira marina]KAA5605043.1 MFS transporter [Roseospira marina]MBB4314946.1 MFS family permease [Roseospira marina]MBB5087946.1 MFS family permease [Roseospira marina]
MRDPARLAVRATVLCSAALTVMAGATISPSLPALYDHFADTEGVEVLARMVLTLPALFIALGSPLAGFAVDRLGRKPVIVCGALLYVLGGTTGLYVDSLSALLIGRAVLGLAVACVMTGTVTLIGDYYRGADRGRMMGNMAASMSWGGVVFVLLGGALAELHWRGPFGVYMIALGLLPALLLVLWEPDEPTPERAGRAGGASEAPTPDGPVHVRWSLVGLVYFAAFMLNVTFYIVPTQAPFLLREMGIVAPFAAGFAIAAMNVAGGVTSLQFGRLRAVFSPPALFGLSFGMIAIGFVGVWAAEEQVGFMIALLFAGFGVGATFPNITNWMMTLAPPHLRGRLVGGTTMSIFLGQFVSPMFSQPLVGWLGQPATFGVTAGVVALVSALFWGLAMVYARGAAARARSL